MKSAVDNCEIEVIDEGPGLPGRVRIREHHGKASIFLGPGQLEEHARACLALAEIMRSRR